MRIGICGAGVGGLATAYGLMSLGYEVDIFERASELRTTGAGFNLWPNAGRAIHGLGLRDQYEKISVKLDRYIELDSEGKGYFQLTQVIGRKNMALLRSGCIVRN